MAFSDSAVAPIVVDVVPLGRWILYGDVSSLESTVYDLMSVNVEQQSKELVDQYEKLESELKVHYINLSDTKWDEFL